MCGIIGVIGKTLPRKEQFTKARETMEHRGPDDCGIYYNERKGVALGHRRLSIIDLTNAGKQPMWSSDNRYCIIFNGEIYNYLELRRELEPQHEFKTTTDTEVLLAAYIQWGVNSLGKLNGMFAFAIWDTKEHKLFACRDRVGIKPFYYAHYNGSFYFASEIKALRVLGIPTRANERIIFDYLYHGLYDHTNETFFDGIAMVQAGMYIEVKDGQTTFTEYWNLENAVQKLSPPKNQEEAQEKFSELLKDSIKLRFRSDVPVGLTLSSGLDSNGLLNYSQKIISRELDMFSMCFNEEAYNECRLISSFLSNTQKSHWHTSELMSEQVLELAMRMNTIQDEPYGGIPAIAYGKMNQQAQEMGITVLLEGEGLDELLAGYSYYRIEYEKDQCATTEKDSVEFGQGKTKLVHRDILEPSLARRHRERTRLVFKRPFKTNLANALYRDFRHTKLPRVLRLKDHTSMAYSRETRVPYLDHRIVEFCFSLSDEYKISPKTNKVLARKMFASFLPDSIKHGSKIDSGAVQGPWLRGALKPIVKQIITSDSFHSRKLWNADALPRKFNNFFRGAYDNSFFVWQCINLELWHREFID